MELQTVHHWYFELIGFNNMRDAHMYKIESSQTGIVKRIEVKNKDSLYDVLFNIEH